PVMVELGMQLRTLFGPQRSVFLAASTREGEEELLLNAFQPDQFGDLLIVIVPRHPQRFDEVAGLIEKHGLRMQRRSSANVPITADTQVVLGDSMGEMFAYYAACDIAFIGGSLLPFGGQNLIEACAVGKPVLIGPHTYNFAQATELAVAKGAALQIADAGELMHQLHGLLQDAPRMTRMGEAGLQFVSDNQGVTGHAITFVSLALNQALYNETVSSQVKSAP
ncbi:MAG TPA: glycosyltransferase, partial [Sideroxyarcus sp.]|nr:glycosyltransferase [Sideroxyarcus sp.]